MAAWMTGRHDARSGRFLMTRLIVYLIAIGGLALYMHFRDKRTQSSQPPASDPGWRPPVVGEASLSKPSQPMILLLVPKEDPTDWAPVLAKLQEQYGEDHGIMKVEVASGDGTADFFQVQKLPAVVLSDKDGCRPLPLPTDE